MWDHELDRGGAQVTARSAPVAGERDPLAGAGPGPGSTAEVPELSMDLLTLLRITVRNWFATVPALLLTVLVLLVVVVRTDPTYEATGAVALLSPPEPPELTGPDPQADPESAIGQNPFVRYGDLSVVADIVARIVAGQPEQKALEAEGVTGSEVVANRFQRGPVIEVTGEGPTPEAAIRSTELTLLRVETVLAELQQGQGADPEYFITTAPLEPPSEATALYGARARVALGAAGVGVLVTLAAGVVAEALRRRYRRTAAERPVAGRAAKTPAAIPPGP